MDFYAGILKTSAPVFEEQLETPTGKEKDIPEKVVEIANAIRRDNPSISDESAYRMAWDTYKGERGGPRTGPIHKGGGGADPTGIRAKLKALGAKARSHPEEPIESKEANLSGQGAGFMVAFLSDSQGSQPMEKTAQAVSGSGPGLACAIDALVKGSSWSLQEMMDLLGKCSRVEFPGAVQRAK
jgi:hypothetical protein